MKKSIIIILMIFSFPVFSQLNNKVIVEVGGSYTRAEFKKGLHYEPYFIKGIKSRLTFGYSVSSFYNNTLSFSVRFTSLSIDPMNFILEKERRKLNLRIAGNFKLSEKIYFRPFIGGNFYNSETHIIYKKDLYFDFGADFSYELNDIDLYLTLSTFPEFNQIHELQNPASYFPVKTNHYPYLAFGVNINLQNRQLLKPVIEENYAAYLSKYRGFRIEGGILNFAKYGGIIYRFNNKYNEKRSIEIGTRFGGFDNSGTTLINANLFMGIVSPDYSKPSKKNAKYVGLELGGGIIAYDGQTSGFVLPYPLVHAFLEFEYTRFYIRTGAGTGFYGAIGYKLF